MSALYLLFRSHLFSTPDGQKYAVIRMQITTSVRLPFFFLPESTHREREMERRICRSVEETRGTQGGWKNTHRPPLVPLFSLCVSFRARERERASLQRRVNIKTLSPLFLFYYYYYLPPSSFRLVLLLNDKRGPSTEHQRSSSCQMFPLFEYKKKKGPPQMNCCYKSTT